MTKKNDKKAKDNNEQSKKHNHQCQCDGEHSHECNCHHDEDIVIKDNNDNNEQGDIFEDIVDNVETAERIEDLEGKYMQLMAEYQNSIRRQQDELDRMRVRANEILIEQLIPILDDFDHTLEHTKDDGVQRVYDKLLGTLIKAGLEVIDPKGEAFDPHTQEAIETVDGKSDVVITVHRKGYKLGNKVLRPAIVAVGNGS